ncbi:MAG: cell division protein ZapB [Alphaproteobacteria bacterium]|nr:cell division protein ZapB [Alphaproteobacteria bacterium]
MSLLRARHAALEAEHAALQKSYERLRQQQASTAQRLDGAIASLHDVLSS